MDESRQMVNETRDSGSWPHLAAGALALVGTVFVQFDSLSSTFKHDDFLHLYGSVDPGLWSYAWQPMGGHVFPIAKLLLGSIYALFGLNPLPFALVQLGVHCANVLLLYGILLRLTRRPTLAAICAGLWGAAPLHVLTLGWFTCIQILLCLFFLLVILYQIAGAARRQQQPTVFMRLGWMSLSLCAMGSYALGNLVPIALPGLAFLLDADQRSRRRTALSLLPAALLPLIYAQVLSAHGQGIDPLGVDLVGVFSIAASLLSVGFAGLLAAPLFTIDANGASVLSWWGRDYTAIVPETIWISIPAVLVFVVAIVLSSGSTRRWLLACGMLLLGSYLLIAIGRAPMLPLVPEAYIATSARYHYLPSAFIAMTVALVANSLPYHRFAPSGSPRAGVLAIGLAVALLLTAGVDRWTASRVEAGENANSRDHLNRVDEMLWATVHSVPGGSEIHFHNAEFFPVRMLNRMGVPIDRFPHLAGYYAISVGEPILADRAVRFIESDVAYVARVRQTGHSLMSRIFTTIEESRAAGATAAGSPRETR